jgi:hypothetical protein
VCATICFPPTYIVAAPTTPSRTLAESPISDVAVSVRMTLSSNRALHGKNLLFALFRVISLDHPHAAQRFGEPPGHLGVDLATLAENRADVAKALFNANAKQPREPTAISVSGTLMRSNNTSAMLAATKPPAKSTSPFPEDCAPLPRRS